LTAVFTGAVPRPVIEQALKVVDVSGVKDVTVCCSGSFRVEQALTGVLPVARLHSNDVSLLTCAIGHQLVNRPLAFSFQERLVFLEDLAGPLPFDRLAALCLAAKMSGFAGKNKFAVAHYSHHVENAQHYFDIARTKLQSYLDRIKLTTFFDGDFVEHARRGVERGDLIVAWPPTYKGGYERLYKFLDANTKWEPPAYGVWDPDKLVDWVRELRSLKANFVVCADHPLEGEAPAAIYEPGRNKRVYLYAGAATRSSLRRQESTRAPFTYTPADPWSFTEQSKVQFLKMTGPHMNFLKDRYLAPGLRHSDGTDRWAVLVDGQLAGGFIYTISQMGDPSCVYLLCDFSTHRDRKLSKLIAMLAASEETISSFERARIVRVKSVFTTAFTDKPISMKYRGIYELAGRKEGFLNYTSEVRRVPTAAIYREWYDRFAKAERPAPRGRAQYGADDSSKPRRAEGARPGSARHPQSPA
jgi:hypothetical protein